MSWLEASRARLRLLFGRRAAESRMDQEFRFHLEMQTEHLMREEGLGAAEARRRAYVAFGGVENHKETLRDGRGLAWLGGLTLDFKLGGRMLLKYPGITVVAGLAMAFGIFAGAVSFKVVTMITDPAIPLPAGDRLVKLRNYDVKESAEESRSLHDFLAWRQSLRSVTDLGAYRDVERNLIVKAGDARPLQVAEITSAAFRIAPEPPLLGRTLTEADERAGAPPVVVIGHETWETRFASDSGVVGSIVQLGESFATVVGVMREGYGFPLSHDAWMPLRVQEFEGSPRAGPAMNIFGLLAPGVSVEQAQSELAALGRRAAAERPATHQNLQAQLALYAKQFADLDGGDMLMNFGLHGFAVMLLVLVCSNVALLLFARAATRESELIVRSALGATRVRIVAQLFAEALVLGVIAAGVGLGAAEFGLRRWGGPFLEANYGELPFWYDLHLSFSTVLYALGLMLLAAAIAGVLPALKVTRGMSARLRQAAAGAGGPKFGGVWTAVIIAQVAFTTAFPAGVLLLQQQVVRQQNFDAGFPSEEYLAVEVAPAEGVVGAAQSGAAATAQIMSSDAAGVADPVRFRASLETLRQRLASEPGVAGVTFVDRLPGQGRRRFLLELDEVMGAARSPTQPASGAGGVSEGIRGARTAYIDANYFDVLRAPVIAGRPFQVADLSPDARVVIVDQGFVEQVFLGRNVVGQRVRLAIAGEGPGSLADPTRPWYQIVGVVKELGMGAPHLKGRAAGLYLPAAPGQHGATNMLVHVRGDPLALIPRVRAVAASIDPTLRLSELQRVDQVLDRSLWVDKLLLRMTLLLSAIALMLSLAGIYAVMSFTVARRTREIGIRVALGANARRVVASIFRRPLTQVVIGVSCGAMLAAAFLVMISTCQDGVCQEITVVTPVRAALLLVYAMGILGVCLLACVVPTRRALGVEPTEAMRAE